MPVCIKCIEEKDEEEFSWRWQSLGIRQKVCKVCRRQEVNHWYERHREKHRQNVYKARADRRQLAREFVHQYLSEHPCMECGESNPIVLEFDHLEDKDYNISHMISQGFTIERIQQEISRCQVLCANCHRRKTARDQGWFSGD